MLLDMQKGFTLSVLLDAFPVVQNMPCGARTGEGSREQRTRNLPVSSCGWHDGVLSQIKKNNTTLCTKRS